VGEILKEKNVGENAGGMQVDEKELTVAKVAKRGCETVRQAQQPGYLVDRYGRCGE
jgi:hypothetical protein